MRRGDYRWGTRPAIAALVLVVGMVVVAPLVVGERGAQPRHVPTSEARPATPRPPRVGGGSEAGSPTPTPTSEPTAAATASPSIEAVTPSVVAAQAILAGAPMVERAADNATPGDANGGAADDASPDAGSIPAPGSKQVNPSLATAVATKATGSGLYQGSALRAAIEASRWPPHLWLAVQQVVMCESRGLTTAVSPAGYRGLMQVAPWLHGPVPADAVGQLNQAFDVWRKQGWQAWPICGAR